MSTDRSSVLVSDALTDGMVKQDLLRYSTFNAESNDQLKEAEQRNTRVKSNKTDCAMPYLPGEDTAVLACFLRKRESIRECMHD